jgi:cation:H+ antiporter
MVYSFLLLITGFAILIKGADLLVGGSSSIAKRFGISNLAIGLTVVAFGTSMPELVVSLLSALDGRNDATFGNVLGSNNFNLLFILGVAGIIYPLVVQRNTVKFEVPFSLLVLIALFILVNDSLLWNSINFPNGATGILSRIDAGILLLLFASFLVYIYSMMKNTSEVDEGEPVKIYSPVVSIGLAILGVAMLIGGGHLAVTNAIEIATEFGLSQKLIGLTILAVGTSLPELATSAVAAYRKNTDIAIGNVVGSNIFNITLILGVTGMVNPIPYNGSLNFDLMVCGAATIMLMIFMFTLNQRKLDRWEAVLMFMSYIVYTVYLIGADSGLL